MRIVVIRVLFTLIFLISNNLAALCVPFTDEGQIQVGIDEASSADKARVKRVLENYLAAAKNNNVKKVASYFSQMDGSVQYLKKELKEIPDKFSDFAGIKAAEISSAFIWGNYILTMVDYKHVRGEATMLETFFCTKNVCQLSNIFVRPNSPENLVSRFIYRYRVAGQTAGKCPASSNAVFNVLPSTKVDEKNPLTVYLNIEKIGDRVGNLFVDENMKKISKNLAECATRSASISADMNEAEIFEELQFLVSACTVNMKVSSLSPAFNLTSNDKMFFTSYSITGFVKRIADAHKLYSYEDAGLTINVYLVDGVSGEKHIIVLPIHEKDGEQYFDWSYFGNGAGELLVSPEFAAHIKRTFPALIK